MLVHEIRLSNVLNMVSCHDDLKDEIMRVVSTDSDFINSRFTDLLVWNYNIILNFAIVRKLMIKSNHMN